MDYVINIVIVLSFLAFLGCVFGIGYGAGYGIGINNCTK